MSDPARSGRIFQEPCFTVKHWHLQFGASCESEEDARCVLHALEATYDLTPGDAPRAADPGLLDALTTLAAVVKARFEGLEIVASVPRELRAAVEKAEAAIARAGGGSR
jgi:hypothetical protein